MVVPTELSTTTKRFGPVTKCKDVCKITSEKIANLPDDINLIEPYSDAGITKTVARGQYFTTLDDAELNELGSSC